MVITNLRGNIERTQYTADLGIHTGKTRYSLLYRCTDTEHSMRLISTYDNKVVAHERVDRPGPLSWADVRSWAITVASADLRAEHTK